MIDFSEKTFYILFTLCSSLISGLIGVLISNYYFRRLEARKLKFDVLRNIVKFRFFLLSSGTITSDNKEFFAALNEVFIVFHDSKEVLNCLKKLHDELQLKGRLIDNIISLIKHMTSNLDINIATLNDSFIESPFVPK
ncbi:hypothetical protein LEP1GSC188_3150 [Leptospira weilii serovar Topaz str. LT2116]|uniref:Uncharacterized protein n=2 Tax=Leptospira weilii TaxID=28184 RepID=M3EIM5_9LEPT|nr:DUF6680 family protein [Leptospira weilii]EMF80913.1 hypothetical protein LEP1GSC188_3150 [Leptospira weilii serovar Topaz str. LT2116]EMN92553.1 hypothetical protein LEP1GSC108_0436 [Leptospira weilii str. UI 13098]OMI14667.1 hypothetical protein BUQ74_20600 [Leptospira weilii serovar Heyan]